MKPVGPIIKKFIEENQMKKVDVADKVGISYNYLSTIFLKSSIDAELLERICVAIGLNPVSFFTTSPEMQTKNYSDIKAVTKRGNAAVQIGSDGMAEKLLAERERVIEEKNRLIDEKERTIQILMNHSASGLDQMRDM